MLSLLAGLSLPAAAQQDSTAVSFVDQVIEVGANKDFTRAQSTAAVSVITSRDVNKRSAKDIGNSILGQGNGLVSLQETGTYFEQNPTFYVRGLQSLSTSTPLVLVDGVERLIPRNALPAGVLALRVRAHHRVLQTCRMIGCLQRRLALGAAVAHGARVAVIAFHLDGAAIHHRHEHTAFELAATTACRADALGVAYGLHELARVDGARIRFRERLSNARARNRNRCGRDGAGLQEASTR